MFTRDRTRSTDPGKIATVLGAGTCMEGTLTGDGSVRIDGCMNGTIEVAGDVIVAETAKVQARICARTVKISGTVDGDVHSTGLVELASSAVVSGDVSCADLVVDKGAVLNGCTRMPGDASGGASADSRSDAGQAK